jgi:adenylate cyclase
MAVLESLVEAAASSPAYWVLASRTDGPQAERVRATMPWLRQVTLAPLAEDATAAILTHLLHGALSEEVALDLARRTGGNAEFAEEIALALLDEGAVVQAGEGWRVTRDLSTFAVPSTVHEMIEARIDALDTASKTVLQDASVIGVRFSRALLELVATRPTTLDGALAELVATELVRAPAEDDPWYSFRNPVVRDVAYGLLLHRRRPLAHRRVAEALLELHPGDEADNAEMLAHHFEAAGDADRAAFFRDMTAMGTTTGGTTR